MSYILFRLSSNSFKSFITSFTSERYNSKIYLNRENSIMQSIILKKLMVENIGKDKIPMVILEKIDSPKV